MAGVAGVAGVAVKNSGNVVWVPRDDPRSTLGPPQTVFLQNGVGALERVPGAPGTRWCVYFADGTFFDVPAAAAAAGVCGGGAQDPFGPSPVCPTAFAAIDGCELVVSTFTSATDAAHSRLDLKALFPVNAPDRVALRGVAVCAAGAAGGAGGAARGAVLSMNDPRPGFFCVYVFDIPLSPASVRQTPNARARSRVQLHALSRDGQRLLVTDGPEMACFDASAAAGAAAGAGAACGELWRRRLHRNITHVVPCGARDFALRVGDHIQVASGGDGRVRRTLADHGLHGARFAVSPDGSTVVHEDLTTSRFMM
jgi:hypothetical protein